MMYVYTELFLAVALLCIPVAVWLHCVLRDLARFSPALRARSKRFEQHINHYMFGLD